MEWQFGQLPDYLNVLHKMSLLSHLHNFSVQAYARLPGATWRRIFQINLLFNASFILCGPLAFIRPSDSYPIGLSVLMVAFPIYFIWCGFTWFLLAVTQRGHSKRTFLYSISSILLLPLSIGIMLVFFSFSEP